LTRQYRGYSGGGFGPPLTPMVKKLIIANGAVWLLQLFIPGLTEYGWVRTTDVFNPQNPHFWQPFTYMWLHSPRSPMHILFNMFALWMFGGQLEMVWGSRRFLRFYVTTGVGAGVIILIWHLVTQNTDPTLGASGAVFGILTAFSLLWPDRTIVLLFPPIPIKAIWFIPVLFVLQLAMGGTGNISHIGHLGGVIVAAIMLREQTAQYLSLRKLRYRWQRYRMRGKLRAVRREEWERRRREDEDHRYH
jgi:membrane associated rhomboid family serine protease